MKAKKALTTYFLMFLLLFQAIGALPAGLALIADPSGAKLWMNLEMLQYAPFADFLIPGLFLFLVLGLFPLFILYGLVSRPSFKVVEEMNLYREYHWSWTLAYFFGLLLIMWINMQLFFLKEWDILHFVYSSLGVLIVLVTLLPATQRDYRVNENI